jgi:transcriptional regulator with XRE-family HTH domain
MTKMINRGKEMPVLMESPHRLCQQIATRMKTRRLQIGWSRKTLAARSGVSQWTLKHFEGTGQIALETLVKVAVVLNDSDSFARLFAPRSEPPASMAELEKLHPAPRKRGRTLP